MAKKKSKKIKKSQVKTYTLSEAGEQVGVHKKTIVRWIDTGKVKVKRRKNSRREWVFTTADLDKFLAFRDQVNEE